MFFMGIIFGEGIPKYNKNRPAVQDYRAVLL